MHIAFNGWFWDRPNTGSGQYIRRLLTNLRRIAPNLQMTLVLPPHNDSPDDLPENVSIITTTGRGGNLGKVIFEQRTFPQMVRRIEADLAHVPYWGPPLSSPAPLITSVLDVIPLALPEYSRGFRARLYTSLVSAAARGSAHTITLSVAAKTDIINHLGIPDSMITPIHLAADEAYHPHTGAEHDEDVREKYNLPDRFVFYISGYDRRKQVNRLLDAYTYVVQGEDVPLVLGGREPDWSNPMFPDMRKYAAELVIADFIHWTGYVDEEDKPALYRLADVFVSPSSYEGFGLPLLEAMSSGTPVVANRIDVFEETTGDGAYLVDDAREMGGAIIALLLEDALREEMIKRGLAQAANFSWRKTAGETLSVYEQVLRNL